MSFSQWFPNENWCTNVVALVNATCTDQSKDYKNRRWSPWIL